MILLQAIHTEKARGSLLWGLHRAQLTWQYSCTLLWRYKQMTMPGGWTQQTSEVLLMLETDRPFLTKLLGALFPLPPPWDLGVDRILWCCYWLFRCGNTRDCWKLFFLLMVEGMTGMYLRWALTDGMSFKQPNGGKAALAAKAVAERVGEKPKELEEARARGSYYYVLSLR